MHAHDSDACAPPDKLLCCGARPDCPNACCLKHAGLSTSPSGKWLCAPCTDKAAPSLGGLAASRGGRAVHNPQRARPKDHLCSVPLCPKHVKGHRFTEGGLKSHITRMHSQPAAGSKPAAKPRAPASASAVKPSYLFYSRSDAVSPSDSDWAWAASQPFEAIVAPAGARVKRRLHPAQVRHFREASGLLWARMQQGDRAAWWLHLALPRLVLPAKGASESDETSTAHLCRMFVSGQFKSLFDLALAREQAARDAKGERGAITEKRRADAAARLVKVGELSRGLARATSNDSECSMNSDTLDRLKELHPTTGAISAEDLHLFSDAAASISDQGPDARFKLSEESLKAAIKRAPRATAGAGSGWVFEHYAYLALDDEETFINLLNSIQLLFSGKMAPEITTALGSCTLIALAKPDGGLRPIAIGEVLRRLASRAVCHQWKEAWGNRFSPFQYGVQTKGGAEQVLHVIRTHHSLHPRHALIRLDCRNAFNCVSRTAFLRAVLDDPDLRELFPFIAQFYLPQGALHTTTDIGTVFSTLRSVSGTQQGDPLGPFLFALAIHAGVKRVLSNFKDQDVIILAYLDDIHVLGPPVAAAEAFMELQKELALVDLELRAGKNHLWCRDSEDVDAFMARISQEDAANTDMPPVAPLVSVNPEGFVVLGVPYGPYASAAITAGLSAGKRNLQSKLDGISLLVRFKYHHEAMKLLLLCAAPTVGYVQRSAPPSLTQPMCVKADVMLRASAAEVFNLGDSLLHTGRAQSQIHLPDAEGGPALRSAVSTNNYAYFCSVAAFAPACVRRWPHLKPAFDKASVDPTSSDPNELSIPVSSATTPADWSWVKDLHTQHRFICNELDLKDVLGELQLAHGGPHLEHFQSLCSSKDGAHRRRLLDTSINDNLVSSHASSQDDVATLRTLAQWKGTKCAGRCLFTCAPTSDARTYLSGPVLEYSMRRLLRLPIPGFVNGAMCRCKEIIDEFGDHADTCTLMHGERSKRHHTVNSVAVHTSALQACLPAEIEAPHLNEDNNGRPADTLVSHGLEPVFGKRAVCYDVTGIGSSVEQYLDAACNNVGGAMTFGIARKLRSTRTLEDDKVVVPLPFESQGGLHDNWRITFKQWAAHWAGCGEGRGLHEQGQLVRCWLVKAATVVQIAQHRLSTRLTGLLRSTDPRSGAAVWGRQPMQLMDLHAQRDQAPSF